MRYDLNLLRVFVALMEERSVTRAADRLGITQPALSNALARLREMLVDPLFIRERYGMLPTQKAEALAPVIVAALSSLDGAILGQQAFDPAKAQQLFTLAPNGYVEFVLMPALVARLRERAPDIRLRMTPFGTDLVETGVISGNTSAVFGRIVDPPDNLVVQHLMDDGLACVLRADHPQVTGQRISKQQYEQLRHVNMLPAGRLRTGVFKALEQHGLRRDVVVSVTHFLAIPDIIAVSDYCATLPRLICRRLAGDKRLKVVPTPVDLGTFPMEMAWHVRYRDDPAHQWLRAQIVEVASEVSKAR